VIILYTMSDEKSGGEIFMRQKRRLRFPSWRLCVLC